MTCSPLYRFGLWPLIVRLGAAVGIAAAVLLSIGFPDAAAQVEGPAVRGTLTATDEEGERAPVEGVDVFIIDLDGTEVARGTSGPDGVFEVPLPGAGDFVAEIDSATLPEGISLRNADRARLDLSLSDTQVRNVLFPLNKGGGAAAEQGDNLGVRFLRLSIDGLIFGLIIAMSSIGLSLIFGTTGLTNFAHGELVTFGAFMTLLFNKGLFEFPLIVAAILAVVASAGMGVANEKLLWRPLRNRGTGLIAMLVVSIGLSILARYFVLYLAGGRRERYSQFALQTGIDIGPISVVPRDFWIIGISVTVLVGVALAVQRTKLGKAMRAVADNRDLAESSGIDVEKIILAIWIAGAALAGLGGVLFGLNQGVSWDMGFELLLLMFAAVTLGGLGTAYGPLFGALAVGVFINVSTLVIPPELKNIGALGVLVAILLVRPQGIFGQAERIG